MNGIRYFMAVFVLICMMSCNHTGSENTGETGREAAGGEEWIQLFNGENMDHWIPKIRGQESGVNYRNTFIVEDGLLKVNYAEYDSFRSQFGHLFYDEPFTSYRLRAEYRFVGKQMIDGADWAWANSGLMLHSPHPDEMGIDQDFPISIEVQLLGGPEEGDRSTANLCTPGTMVHFSDTLNRFHCINSLSDTYRGEQWVTVEVEVYADSLVRHFVNGQEVLSYTDLQHGGGAVSGLKGHAPPEGTPISSGHISIQSESHPVEFRKIELMRIE